jgi:hypothetical protein
MYDEMTPQMFSGDTIGNPGFLFPDPFLDMASLTVPRSYRNIVDLCERLWLKNGTYRQAVRRIVRYFITEIAFDGLSDKEKSDRLKLFFNNKLRAKDNLMLMGDDLLCYGNSFSSIFIPFRRFLVDPKTGNEEAIEAADWRYENWKFMSRNRRTNKWSECKVIDRRSPEEEKIQVRRWSPRQIRLRWHPHTGRYEYFWDIDPQIQTWIRQGDKFIIQDMPLEVLETVRQQKLFKFNDNVVYHMKEDTLAGVKSAGWGISGMLSVWGQAWYTQVLKRYNEALAQDYVVPFRVITPGSKGGSVPQADPLLSVNLGDFKQQVMMMLREHRRDPADWHILPTPLNYQTLGGEARNMSTPELMTQATDDMLNSAGIPAELYRMSLQMQVLPAALRLFAQMWPQLVTNYNAWLDWMTDIVTTSMSWDRPERVYLRPVTMADDMELRQIWLQLSAANLISRQTAFSPFNLDVFEEQRRMFEERRRFTEEEQKFQEDEQQRQTMLQQIKGGGGQPPQQGQAASPGQAQGAMTPMDLQAQSQETAQQLVQMPYEQRRQQLDALKAQNPTMHAMVKQLMSEIRQSAASQGQQQLLGQGQQQ